MNTAVSMIYETKVAIEKAWTDLEKAVRDHKGAVRKDTYKKMVSDHLGLVVQTVNHNMILAKEIDKALSAYDEPEKPEDKTKNVKFKSTVRPDQAGEFSQMITLMQKKGYKLLTNKPLACPACDEKKLGRFGDSTKSPGKVDVCANPLCTSNNR